jgi:hypothetical protein
VNSRLLKVEYDYGVFQSLAVTQEPGKRLSRTEVHSSRPVHEDFLYVAPESLSLESVYYCIWVDVVLRDSLRGEVIFVTGHGAKDSWLRITDYEDAQGLAFSQALLDEIAKFVGQMPRDPSRIANRQWLR